MRTNLVSKRQAIGLVLLMGLLLGGCSAKQLRLQALTPEHSSVSHIQDGLAILLVRLDGSHHILRDLEIRNLATQERYSYPFYDNPKLGSSYLDYDQLGGENGALEHMIFLDIPPGKYQITSVSISDKGHQSQYRASDMNSIFFEFDRGSPVYLGELFISLGKKSRSGLLSNVEEVFFMASVRPEMNVKRVTQRYPALQSVNIRAGKIWEQ